jgi:hypothetical protein
MLIPKHYVRNTWDNHEGNELWTIEPVSDIRVIAKCLECMGNIIKKALLERKSLYQTTKVGVCTEVLGSVWLWSRLRTYN